MLMLSRGTGQRLIIICEGRKIEILFREFKGKQVNMGFTADPDVKIHRKEVYDRIEFEKSLEKNLEEGK